MKNLDQRLSKAIQHFWKTRLRQASKQGSLTGQKDAGARSAVTGGAQLDGIIDLVCDLLVESGLPDASVVRQKKVVLPGFFRPTKEWDVLVKIDGKLLAAIEFKSQCGPSYGNNYNNRTEEAIGNATDIWTAYREGVFKPSEKPWLGYLMLLEHESKSTSPVSVEEPHYKVLPEFEGASYAKRYELLCLKMMRERLYDSACFLMSEKKGGVKGEYSEPCAELAFKNFAASLTSRAVTYAKVRQA